MAAKETIVSNFKLDPLGFKKLVNFFHFCARARKEAFKRKIRWKLPVPPSET